MNIKILIIHVSTNTLRYEHMEKMLAESGLPYEREYINEGDIMDITEDILDKYFINKFDCQMHVINPRTSCGLKHIYALERILEQGLDGALILEDDIFLHKNFKEIFLKSIDEYERLYQKEKILISYEDSSLLFVPRSKREPGTYLYDGNYDRYAGAYFINNLYAKAVSEDLAQNKTHLPSDGYQNDLRKRGIIRYLWCHPTIATQGSCNGKINTLLSNKSNRFLSVKWFFKYHYRSLLFWLR